MSFEQTLTLEETSSISENTYTPCSNDTSYGLSSLADQVEDLDSFLHLNEKEQKYLMAVQRYMKNEPVYRRKKTKLKVVRRLQVVRKSRIGYSKACRELWRRRKTVVKSEKLPSLQDLFQELHLRPEKSFRQKISQ